MKKLLMLLVFAGTMPLASMAQDDVYFTPSKEVNTPKVERVPSYSGSRRSVDEYNRYGRLNSYYQKIGTDSLGNDIITFMPGKGAYRDSTLADTAYVYPGSAKFDNSDDYTYTRRMSRWDGFYDPWFYDNFYGPYGWYDPWYTSWYGGGWYDPWYYGYADWYSPWYNRYYGWGWPYRYGWYGWDYPYWGGGVVVNNGGANSGGYSGQRTWSSGRTYGNTNGSRSYGSYTSRSAGNRSFGSRSYQPSNSNNSTRTYNNNAYGTRSYGGFSGGSNGGFSGGGNSGGGRSGGSFGGGGGHFGGGRR